MKPAPFILTCLVTLAAMAGGCSTSQDMMRLAVYADDDSMQKLSQSVTYYPNAIIELSSESGYPSVLWMNSSLWDPTGWAELLGIAIIDNREPIERDSPAWADVLESLSRRDYIWKVAFLSKPIFPTGGGAIDRRQLPLAELLAREAVALAISPDEGMYYRTARIGPNLENSVQYISIPATGAEDSTAKSPEWIVRSIAETCMGRLEADQWFLRWRASGPSGEIMDELTVSAAADKGYVPQSFSISEILAIERQQHFEQEQPHE